MGLFSDLIMDRKARKNIKKQVCKDVAAERKASRTGPTVDESKLELTLDKVVTDPSEQRRLTRLIRKKLTRIMSDNPEVKELWKDRLSNEAKLMLDNNVSAEDLRVDLDLTDNDDRDSNDPHPPTRSRSNLYPKPAAP